MQYLAKSDNIIIQRISIKYSWTISKIFVNIIRINLKSDIHSVSGPFALLITRLMYQLARTLTRGISRKQIILIQLPSQTKSKPKQTSRSSLLWVFNVSTIACSISYHSHFSHRYLQTISKTKNTSQKHYSNALINLFHNYICLQKRENIIIKIEKEEERKQCIF